MGHADLDTTLVYTAGADPQLNQAYQTVMTRLTATPLPPVAPPPQADPALNDPPLSPPSSSGPSHAPEPFPVPLELAPPPVAPLRPPPPLPDWDAWATDWPEPVRQACLQYVQRRTGNLPPHRQRIQALKTLGDLRRFWDWQLAQRPIAQLADLHLADLQAYQTARLAEGRTPATVNRHLSYVLTALKEQAEAGAAVDDSIFRLRHLKAVPPLPRCLPEADCLRLETFARQRLDNPDLNVRLQVACFFVLAHAGLRASECVQLQGRDLDLRGQRLTIRAGKGHKDRTVYLSDLACQALARYLGDAPRPPQSALWVNAKGRPLSYHDLLDSVADLGQAAGVPGVTPHRLRHSLATRLLNAGMDITRIQKLLGHAELKTTMAYAQVLDLTLEADYRQAMDQIERRQPPLATAPELVANWPGAAAENAPTQTNTGPRLNLKHQPTPNSV
jgi:site-specific recombinase XerD